MVSARYIHAINWVHVLFKCVYRKMLFAYTRLPDHKSMQPFIMASEIYFVVSGDELAKVQLSVVFSDKTDQNLGTYLL